jgi:hypothetical protein
VLLGGRPLHFRDVLEQEATAGPALEADREQRAVEPVGDRPRLVEDLDLLRVGPYQVEDLVVGRLGMLQQWSKGRDRLAAPCRGVDQQGSAPLGDVRDLGQDAFLPRPQSVREQVRRLDGRSCARRRPGSTVLSPRSGF